MTGQENTSPTLMPIGTIHTGFEHLKDCPRSGAQNPNDTTIEIFEEFAEGLDDLTFASHLVLLYWFDKSNRNRLTRPKNKCGPQRGVFATRAPFRPNPIAFSVVKLKKVEGTTITVSGLDCLDGTRLIDMKPYIRDLDSVPDAFTRQDDGENLPKPHETVEAS